MKNSRMSVGEDGETCGLSDLDRMIMMMKRALQGSLHLYGTKGFFVFNLNYWCPINFLTKAARVSWLGSCHPETKFAARRG